MTNKPAAAMMSIPMMMDVSGGRAFAGRLSA
jgi:hypothetical protein